MSLDEFTLIIATLGLLTGALFVLFPEGAERVRKRFGTTKDRPSWPASTRTSGWWLLGASAVMLVNSIIRIR